MDRPTTGDGVIPLPPAIFADPPPTRGDPRDLVILRILGESGRSLAQLTIPVMQAQSKKTIQLERFGVGHYGIELTRTLPGHAVGKRFQGSIEIAADSSAVARLSEKARPVSVTPQIRIATQIFDTLGLPAVGVRVELIDEHNLRYFPLMPTEIPRFLQRFRVPEGKYTALLSRPGDVDVEIALSVRADDDGGLIDLRFRR